MATDLITLAEGAALSQFLGPFGKAFGEAALKRAQQLGEQAVGYLKSVGREPQPIAPKVLLPLVQAAALEEDEGLAAKWAALLANAADPEQTAPVVPVYAEILRQLTSREAWLLDMFFSEVNKVYGDDDNSEATRRARVLSSMLEPRSFFHLWLADHAPERLQSLDEWHRFDAMIDGLLRQQVLMLAKSQPPSKPAAFSEHKPDRKRAFFTALGYDFMRACMPPQGS